MIFAFNPVAGAGHDDTGNTDSVPLRMQSGVDESNWPLKGLASFPVYLTEPF
jgi:hypothetical protein